ncbi:roadblock/LC7 domain-containing protein [Actinomadura barringtoniae]|uniref:Roadblock/LC7 domain-containing protein n=1 Tax=Actinomadura barringtoniae TaxID=1427535 RepID=A0A939P9C7_9ACTN|nr:roadblock/LC7 domain-containing protein [Actinomadura barringtoniae]MBO2448310.1 roadblock/LC7 domain-containing protein [Actinomadura barringtoniae]
MTQSDIGGELGWMLDDLVDRVGEVRKALVLSRDGLIMGATRGMTREDAEFLAALAAGFFSLASGARDHLDAGDVRQAVIELDEGLFFVVPAGVGSCLALLSRAGSNAGLVSYEMTMLVKRVSRHLAAKPRNAGLGAE